MARTTLTAKKPEAALVNLGPYPFPKRSDFIFDFPKRTDFGLAALDALKGNAEGVSRSWTNVKVREARMTKHGVRVTFDGAVTEHKSVAEAFRAFRLPMAKHIKFRLGLKAAGSAYFESGGKMYSFALVGFEEPSDSIKI